MDYLSLQSLRVQVGRAVHLIASVAPRGPRQSLTSNALGKVTGGRGDRRLPNKSTFCTSAE